MFLRGIRRVGALHPAGSADHPPSYRVGDRARRVQPATLVWPARHDHLAAAYARLRAGWHDARAAWWPDDRRAEQPAHLAESRLARRARGRDARLSVDGARHPGIR